jgi:ribosome-binding factor A
MPWREQLPAYVRTVIGTFLVREVDLPEGVLASVSHVEVSLDRAVATVWISVLPVAASEEVFARIREQRFALQGAVNAAVRSRVAPRVLLKLAVPADGTQEAHTG